MHDAGVSIDLSLDYTCSKVGISGSSLEMADSC
jgi:hypothetical protein